MPQVVEHLARALADQGVQHVWGMPGGDTLPLIDALHQAGVDFVLVRDEASAGFAADASAQLTGRPGACVATLGPGLTNLLTGVGGALLDRAPVIAITSRARTSSVGAYTHMVLDQTPLMQATGKAVFRISAGNVGREVRRALAIARAPRPGPVWLEIPTDVATAEAGQEHPLPPPPDPAPVPPEAQVVAALRDLKRPAILVGFGGRHAPIQDLAEALRAPVLTTYKAKGAIPETETGWWAGSASLSPVVDRVHQRHLEACDGVVLVGWDPVELRDHWMPGWPDAARVIVLDDHSPTDLPTRIDHLQVGPLPQLVRSLADAVGTVHSTNTLDQVRGWRDGWAAPFEDGPSGPATAVRAVQAATHDDVVVTFDTGAHRITGANVWRAARPDQVLMSNGLASMAYALPAALAAAALGRATVAITGDMGLQMCLGELMVASERGWPLTVVVFVDDELALIALKQKKSSLPSRGVRFQNPDWLALGAAIGGRAEVARGPEAITAAVARGLAQPGVSLVAVPVDERAYLTQM